ALLELVVGPRGRKDAALRYECLRALGRIGGGAGRRVLLREASGRDRVGRLAAAEVLLEAGAAQRVVAAVRELLRDPDRLVHEQAARSAGRNKVESLVPELVRLLEEGRLRAKERAVEALRAVSGRDFGYAPQAWAMWWKAKQAGRGGEPGDAGSRTFSVPTYYDFEVFSDRLLFVVDVSESMNVGDGAARRIDVARDQLRATVEALGEPTRFNVITFAGSPSSWRKGELVPATAQNKRKATEWIGRRLKPRGGTNTHDTLLLALQQHPGLDTLYLLSDGLPTAGRSVVPEEILARVRHANRLRQVRIHTIGLVLGGTEDPAAPGLGEREQMTRFMSRLAEQNDGRFVEIRQAPPPRAAPGR
ncbi:MAG: VWA domain-containing protein, partial [Planctomycetota bacterium]